MVVVLARIYSDTSPPKKASFLPPLAGCFSTVGDRLWFSVFKEREQISPHLITEQKTSQAVKRKNSLSLTGSPVRADGSKGEFVLSLRSTISRLRWEGGCLLWHGPCSNCKAHDGRNRRLDDGAKRKHEAHRLILHGSPWGQTGVEGRDRVSTTDHNE